MALKFYELSEYDDVNVIRVIGTCNNGQAAVVKKGAVSELIGFRQPGEDIFTAGIRIARENGWNVKFNRVQKEVMDNGLLNKAGARRMLRMMTLTTTSFRILHSLPPDFPNVPVIVDVVFIRSLSGLERPPEERE
ncbi:MAG: hypothetical protein ABW007_19425 [Chitinophagaceae bacterium]